MKFLPEGWKEWEPALRLLATLLATALVAILNGELQDQRDVEDQDAYNFEELLRWESAEDARCDTALEMYHGPDDWERLLEACHSEGGR